MDSVIFYYKSEAKSLKISDSASNRSFQSYFASTSPNSKEPINLSQLTKVPSFENQNKKKSVILQRDLNDNTENEISSDTRLFASPSFSTNLATQLLESVNMKFPQDPNQTLISLGMDSLTAVELLSQIEEVWNHQRMRSLLNNSLSALIM